MQGRVTTRNTALVGLVLARLAVSLGYWVYVRGGTEVQAQEDCSELANIGPKTTDQRLGPFQADRETIRVSGDARPTDDTDQVLMDIDLVDDEGAPAGTGASIDEEGSFQENILIRTAGTYSLEITTFSDVEYTVTASECGSSPLGGQADTTGGTTNPSPSPAPKTSATPPKTASPSPKTPAPAPKTPTPAPKDSGSLMKAGGPTTGPVPAMPNGRCPQEFPERHGDACYS